MQFFDRWQTHEAIPGVKPQTRDANAKYSEGCDTYVHGIKKKEP